MAGRSRAAEDNRLTGIQVQTSGLGGAIPKVWGTTRISGNLVWYGDFRSTPSNTGSRAGGKGLAGSSAARNSTYEYSAAVLFALCEGPIGGVGAIWRGKDKSSAGPLGLALTAGNPGQAVWPYLTAWNTPSGGWQRDSRIGYADRYTGQTAQFTDQAIGYSSTAYLSSPRYSLGTDGSVPNHGIEVTGSHLLAGTLDADPAEVLRDLVTSTQYGLGLPGSVVGDLTAWSNFCVASGLLVSPALTRQTTASEWIEDFVASTHAELLWSGGQLRVLPLGDEVINANGRTYIPQLTPIYDLAAGDFLGGQDPVQVTRSSSAQARNRVSVEFLDRSNQYNEAVVVADDQAAIDRYGLRSAAAVRAPWFCAAPAARLSAQLALQRGLGARNTYNFTLNARFAALEPGDIVTLTDENLGLNRAAVRLTRIDETSGGYDCEARDLAIGTAAAASIAHDSGLRWQTSVQTQPALVQPPLIFELPAEVGTTGLSVGVAVAGGAGDPLYGGCRLWLSTDGSTYQAAGVLYGGSRFGVTTNTLPGTGGVTAGPWGVQLAGDGQLLSATPNEAATGVTLIAVGNEFLAYETALLTGAGAYNLGNVHRGLFGSSVGSWPTGSRWARIDQNILRLDNIDPVFVGSTIRIKIAAFNAYGGGEQTLEQLPEYSYLITGTAYNQRQLDPLILEGLRSARNFYQAAAPADGVEGNFWTDTDDFNVLYRHNGLRLYVAGDELTLGSGPLNAPWVRISDLQIVRALDQIAAVQQNVSAVQNSVAAITSDSVLSRGEKPEIIRQIQVLTNGNSGLISLATSLGITTELAEYNSAWAALNAVLSALSPPYTDLASDTPIPATFGAALVSAFTTRAALTNAIDNAASQRAQWSNVTGAGRPADNADVTAAQMIVSRLDPASGRAAPAFSDADGMRFARVVASGEARDGDVVAFSPVLSSVPKVIFGAGGIAAAAGSNLRVQAVGLTTTGFTAIVRAQIVTAGETITDSGASAGGAGNPQFVINRSNSESPFDGRWTFNLTVQIGRVRVAGGILIGGRIDVQTWLRIGGVWTAAASGSFAGFPYLDLTTRGVQIVAVASAVDFSPGAEFGVSATYNEGANTAIVSFDSVVYTLGTVSESSLTPANASPLPWIAIA